MPLIAPLAIHGTEMKRQQRNGAVAVMAGPQRRDIGDAVDVTFLRWTVGDIVDQLEHGLGAFGGRVFEELAP